METIFNDKGIIVEIWLSKEESNNAIVKQQLESLIKKHGTKKQKVAVFYSGKENLTNNMEALLRANRRKLLI